MIASGLIAAAAAVTTLVSGAFFKRAFDAYQQAQVRPQVVEPRPKVQTEVGRGFDRQPPVHTGPPLAAPAQSSELVVREQLERAQLQDLRDRKEKEVQLQKEAAVKAEADEREKRRMAAIQRAGAAVDRLRVEYISSHDGLSSRLLAGTEPIPDEWVNNRLQEMGIPFRYHGYPSGGYSLSPTEEFRY